MLLPSSLVVGRCWARARAAPGLALGPWPWPCAGRIGSLSRLHVCRNGPPRIVSPLHTSAPRHAAPLVVFLLKVLSPITRVGVALGARASRMVWVRLSPERREAIKASLRRKRKYFYGGLLLLLGAGGAYYYTHLEYAPITGRKRFMIFSRSDLTKIIEGERESVMQYLVGDKKKLLPAQHPVTRHVVAIVNQIVSSNQDSMEGMEWTLHVIDNDAVTNALCLPTGDIFLFTGMIKLCQTTEELALILAHEMAHAVMCHGAESLAKKSVTDFLTLFITGIIWFVVPNVFGAYFANSLSKRSAALLLELPYSRKVESEADTVGMKFISRACFDPTKASMVWKNMPALTDKDLEYLYTHPSNETRYESLQEQLPSAYDERAKSNCDDRSKREVRSFKKAVHHSIRVTG